MGPGDPRKIAQQLADLVAEGWAPTPGGLSAASTSDGALAVVGVFERGAIAAQPVAGTILAPGGVPASIITSISSAPMTEVWRAGLMIMQLPATSGATVRPVRIASGKFHGATDTPTPRGVHVCTHASPGTACVTTGWASLTISIA